MPGRVYRKRRRFRVEAVVVLCAIIVGLTVISVFSYRHFFARANAVPAEKSVSSQTASVSAGKTEAPASSSSSVGESVSSQATSASASKTEASAPSSSDTSSSVVKGVQASLQDAAKPLWIHVSTGDQTVTVYDADNQVVKSWLCSTGSPGYDTPKGTFSVYYRCPYFWNSTYQEGAKYAVEFVQHYYLHSVPLDKNNNVIQTIADDLGHEDSHGCVHLAIENAEWIYHNIPNGTKVVVD